MIRQDRQKIPARLKAIRTFPRLKKQRGGSGWILDAAGSGVASPIAGMVAWLPRASAVFGSVHGEARRQRVPTGNCRPSQGACPAYPASSLGVGHVEDLQLGKKPILFMTEFALGSPHGRKPRVVLDSGVAAGGLRPAARLGPMSGLHRPPHQRSQTYTCCPRARTAAR